MTADEAKEKARTRGQQLDEAVENVGAAIEESARSTSGRLCLRSAPGRGTTVVAELPIT